MSSTGTCRLHTVPVLHVDSVVKKRDTPFEAGVVASLMRQPLFGKERFTNPCTSAVTLQRIQVWFSPPLVAGARPVPTVAVPTAPVTPGCVAKVIVPSAHA